MQAAPTTSRPTRSKIVARRSEIKMIKDDKGGKAKLSLTPWVLAKWYLTYQLRLLSRNEIPSTPVAQKGRRYD